MRIALFLAGFFCLLVSGPLYMAAYGSDKPVSASWQTASRESARIAPDPQSHPEAVIQVYAARTYSWRGHLAVHTWISTKESAEDHYRVHHVVGWRTRRGMPALESVSEIPDRLWYGNRPSLLLDIRGKHAETLIPQIYNAVAAYPYPDQYTLWPGPNSNTFTAYVGRRIPALGLELPVTAIGKDYLAGGAVLGKTPSGTGYQFSLAGALGLMLAKDEGVELNVLGLVLGVDFDEPALKLPGVGRVGMAQKTVLPAE